MLHPSYTELMEKINKDNQDGEEPVINSRYSIVIATAKRARELVRGKQPLVPDMEDEKPLSIAVKELYEGQIAIASEGEEDFLDADEIKSLDFDKSIDETPQEFFTEA